MLHGHGDDIYHKKLSANFSSNVPLLDGQTQLIEFWKSKLNMLCSYPETDADSFVEAFAEQHKLKKSEICATHGATEAIYLIAQMFTAYSSTILSPSFAEYEDACRIYKHQLSFFNTLDKMKEYNSKLIWLCNPNNPTGEVFDKDILLQIIDKQSDKIFIIDQTYRYFTLKPTIGYQEAVCRPNLILIDSLTKRYAVPGLRLGYIVANKSITQAVREIKPPWSVNQLAIETGKYLIKHQEILSLNLTELLTEKQRLQTALQILPYVKVYTSDTHFFLCQLTNILARTCKTYLLDNYGLLIRNADNFRNLSPYHIRIATQDRENNQILIEAMGSFANHLTT